MLVTFGMIEPGRKFVQGAKKYRYSINGQEKETELNENITTALYWEYDSRIGRRWNIDPKISASESPYSCFSNNPINRVDINGDKDSTVTTPNGGSLILPDGAKITQVLNSKTMELSGSDRFVNVQPGSVSAFEFNGDKYEARWNTNNGSFEGYAKNGIAGTEAPSLTFANPTIIEQHMEFTKPTTKEAGKVLSSGMAASATALELPPLAAAGAVTTTILTGLAYAGSAVIIVTTVYNLKMTLPAVSIGGYFLDMASQRGKNNGKMDPSELIRIAAKVAAGTATALEMQKWKRHQKNTKERPSRQSKD